MDVIKLRAFCAVAGLGSISKAAEQLNYTQPAISAQIRELENELGNKLLERVGRRIQLTKTGQLFQPHAERLLRDFEDCRRSMPREKDGKGGLLRIGASGLPGVHLLPSLLAGYKKEYPGMSFSISIQSAYVIERMLLDRQIDVGFLGRRTLRRRNLRIAEYPLFKDDLVAVVPVGHRWTTLKKLRLEDFVGESIILPPRNVITRRNVEESFHSLDLDLDVAYEVSNSEAIKRMVAEGLGVTLMCASSAAREASAGWLAVVPIDGKGMARYLSLVTNGEREATADMRAFVDFVLARHAGQELL
jgi:DNA-binding transcriptional LysR family regulator